MNRDKREPDYPTELESQFILRLPEEPARALRELLKSGENLKNHLTIQIDNDMRNGEVRFDHWLMHAKIMDLPTVIESLKTIDNKNFYKTADICQMLICKNEPDQPAPEEEASSKTKKKDPLKVDKKFLWPHGITPPTKNVRKRRFRKTLKKKCVESPEIEKEVKRLLRADNEADSYTWEIMLEDNEPSQRSGPSASVAKTTKKGKSERLTDLLPDTQNPEISAIARNPESSDVAGNSESSNVARKLESSNDARNPESSNEARIPESSNVVDIFGEAVSDSEDEDNINVEMRDMRLSAYYDSRLSDNNSVQGMCDLTSKRDNFPIQFDSHMFQTPNSSTSHNQEDTLTGTGLEIGSLCLDEDDDYQSPKEDMSARIEQLRVELEELKQRRQRTQQEITGLDNLALRQRFQETLHSLNQDIMYKEMEYQGSLVLQNSDYI